MPSPTSAPLLTHAQIEALDLAYARALSPLRVQVPLRCSQWANEYFYLSPESSAIEGTFECWPYQVAILDCMGNDDIRRVTWKKCSRVGYTKCLAATTGYFAHHKRRNVVIWLPTEDEATEFAKDTIDPMTRDVPVIAELLTKSTKNNKENTLGMKSFAGSTLHVKGGRSPRSFRRLTKDVAIYDELDGFDSDISGEGDPVSLGDNRISDSAFPKSIRGSTPTIENQSLIERSAGEADLLFRYQVVCLHCDRRQHFVWAQMKWQNRDPETVYYECEHCHAALYYSDLWQLQNPKRGARWEADDGHWIDEDSNLRDSSDAVVEWCQHVAFELWAAYSFMFPWPQIVHEWIEAQADVVKLKAFINTRLGSCWKEEVRQVDASPLLQRRETYDRVPDQAVVLTAGVDVQMDRFEWEVVAWGAGEESWSIACERLYGDMQAPQTWSALLEMLRKQYLSESGNRMRVRLVCIDSGYLAEEVYALSRRAGSQWLIPTKGSSVLGKPIAQFPRRPNDKGVYLTTLGVDNAKETIYQRLMLDQPGPGYMHFPVGDAWDEEYFAQLTGEVKRPRRYQGRNILWWSQRYARVERLDCWTNALAAVRIVQTRFGVSLDGRVVPARVETTDAPRQPEHRPMNRNAWIREGGKWL